MGYREQRERPLRRQAREYSVLAELYLRSDEAYPNWTLCSSDGLPSNHILGLGFRLDMNLLEEAAIDVVQIA
jgi:hypothetical protein